MEGRHRLPGWHGVFVVENVAVVLVSPRNPLNIGAAARAMANFGFPDLRLVNAYRVAAEEARSSPNAGHVLDQSRDFDTVTEAIADAHLVIGTTSAQKRDVRLEVARLEEGAQRIRAAALIGKVSLLFGSEKFGLSNEDMNHCHFLLRIPTVEATRSMNLGQAVAVTLYELIRQSDRPSGVSLEERMAPAGMLDEMTARVYEALTISGYVHNQSALEKLRRLTRRMNLREDDAVMWLGMVRQILWKLKQQETPDDTSGTALRAGKTPE